MMSVDEKYYFFFYFFFIFCLIMFFFLLLKVTLEFNICGILATLYNQVSGVQKKGCPLHGINSIYI